MFPRFCSFLWFYSLLIYKLFKLLLRKLFAFCHVISSMLNFYPCYTQWLSCTFFLEVLSCSFNAFIWAIMPPLQSLWSYCSVVLEASQLQVLVALLSSNCVTSFCSFALKQLCQLLIHVSVDGSPNSLFFLPSSSRFSITFFRQMLVHWSCFFFRPLHLNFSFLFQF